MPRPQRFPVLNPPDDAPLYWVPWGLVEPHAPQAMRNHSQTLERLAERGGLDICELAAVLDDKHWSAYAGEPHTATMRVLTHWRDWLLEKL